MSRPIGALWTTRAAVHSRPDRPRASGAPRRLAHAAVCSPDPASCARSPTGSRRTPRGARQRAQLAGAGRDRVAGHRRAHASASRAPRRRPAPRRRRVDDAADALRRHADARRGGARRCAARCAGVGDRAATARRRGRRRSPADAGAVRRVDVGGAGARPCDVGDGLGLRRHLMANGRPSRSPSAAGRAASPPTALTMTHWPARSADSRPSTLRSAGRCTATSSTRLRRVGAARPGRLRRVRGRPARRARRPRGLTWAGVAVRRARPRAARRGRAYRAGDQLRHACTTRSSGWSARRSGARRRRPVWRGTGDPVAAAQAVARRRSRARRHRRRRPRPPGALRRRVQRDRRRARRGRRTAGVDARGAAGRPPRAAHRPRRRAGAARRRRRHGAIDVRILTLPDGSRRAIVDITGTESWTPLPTPDVTSLTHQRPRARRRTRPPTSTACCAAHARAPASAGATT